jgi:hypothetical protein
MANFTHWHPIVSLTNQASTYLYILVEIGRQKSQLLLSSGNFLDLGRKFQDASFSETLASSDIFWPKECSL